MEGLAGGGVTTTRPSWGQAGRRPDGSRRYRFVRVFLAIANFAPPTPSASLFRGLRQGQGVGKTLEVMIVKHVVLHRTSG